MPQLELIGFHSHIGTFILDPDAYRTSCTILVDLAMESERLGTGPIRYLNVGGGFASRARLHFQYLPPEQATPSFDSYAAAICDTITARWPAGRPLPRLLLETGRAMVDEAGYLISSVVAVKQRPIPAENNIGGVLGAYGKATAQTRSMASSVRCSPPTEKARPCHRHRGAAARRPPSCSMPA